MKRTYNSKRQVNFPLSLLLIVTLLFSQLSIIHADPPSVAHGQGGFPLYADDDAVSTVKAEFNASNSELLISGHGQIDRAKWHAMTREINSANGAENSSWLGGIEDFDIRFSATAADQPIRFPEDSSGLFGRFDGHIYFNDHAPTYLDIDTSDVTNMSYLFYRAGAFNEALSAGFATGNVTKMNCMFSYATAYNQALPASFDTANVIDMSFMFSYAKAYNQALPAAFDTSNVEDMRYMFGNAESFNQALPESFNTAKVKKMNNMFHCALSFNQALPTAFSTANVTNMSSMFANAEAYNQLLPDSFDTSNVVYMDFMFYGALAYNQALPAAFDTGNVTTMKSMFSRAVSFNQVLPESFDTSNVTDMSSMFHGAFAYDQPLPTAFNTAKVTNMNCMFCNAHAYNQILPASFDTSNVVDMAFMFFDATSYNQKLPAAFETAKVTNMNSIFSLAKAYNQPFPEAFDTSAVTDMRFMFCFNDKIESIPFGDRVAQDTITDNNSFYPCSKLKYLTIAGVSGFNLYRFGTGYTVKKQMINGDWQTMAVVAEADKDKTVTTIEKNSRYNIGTPALAPLEGQDFSLVTLGTNSVAITALVDGLEYKDETLPQNANQWLKLAKNATAILDNVTADDMITIRQIGVRDQTIVSDDTVVNDFSVETFSPTEYDNIQFSAQGYDSGVLTGVDQTMIYSVNDGDWQTISATTHTVSGLFENDTIHVAKAAHDHFLQSASKDLAVARAARPAASFTATSDSGGTWQGLSDDDDYKIGEDGHWQDVGSANIPDEQLEIGKNIYIYRPFYEHYLSSDSLEINITQDRPNLTQRRATYGNNAQIIGDTSGMVYRNISNPLWTNCTGGAITGLAAGSYQVKRLFHDDKLSSSIQTIDIENPIVVLDNNYQYAQIDNSIKNIANSTNVAELQANISANGELFSSKVLNSTAAAIVVDIDSYQLATPKLDDDMVVTGDVIALKIDYETGSELLKYDLTVVAVTDETADDTPADDTPTDDTPADDTPADDAPADDTPTDDTPADDTSTDDTDDQASADQDNQSDSDKTTDDLTDDVDKSYRGGTVTQPDESNSKVEDEQQPAQSEKTEPLVVLDRTSSDPLVVGQTFYRDVAQNAWYAPAVADMVVKRLMFGTAKDSFSPEQPASRAMVATVIYRMAAVQSANSTSSYDDVASDQWYYDAVNWASKNGIVSGYGDGRFGPNDDISRQQIVVILYRFAKFQNYTMAEPGSLSDFSDAASIANYAQEAFAWAVSEGIVKGMADGRLAPQEGATRAQLATLLSRFTSKFVNNQ